VLGIVPARGGSKRVPRKNVRLLAGKPLVAYAIEAALAARRISKLVVSSDDGEVLEIAKKYDPALALRRPAEMATDASPAIEYVRHALEVLETSGDAAYEAVAIIQPSSPFTLPQDIDSTIQLLEESKADSAVTVMQVEHALHPTKFKVMQGTRLLPYIEEECDRMAANELPKVYVRNCSVYAIRRETLNQGKIIGADSRGHLMPRERSVDINDELDFEFVQFLATSGRKAIC
jgi:CMP-N-acetylneuraminic acid synthetase